MRLKVKKILSKESEKSLHFESFLLFECQSITPAYYLCRS